MVRARVACCVLVLLGGALAPLSYSRAQSLISARPALAIQGGDRPLRLFSGQSGRWAWLQRTGRDATLFFREGGQAAVQVASGTDWVEVVLEGNAAWILQRRANKGALLRVEIGANRSVDVVKGDLHDPGGLQVQNGRVYWLERTQPVGFGPGYLPASGPTLRLTRREASGVVSALGAWPGGPDADCAPGAEDVIGELEGAVWVRVRRLSSTEFVRFPLAGGAPELAFGEPGAQHGVIWKSQLHWTAPSAEAPSAGLVSVRRLESGTPVGISDWLPGDGQLLTAEGRLYYAAGQLYRLPPRLAQAEPLRAIPAGQVGTDGVGLVLLTDVGGPEALPEKESHR